MDQIIRINVLIDGNASACMYQYKDDVSSIYFSNILVDAEIRNKGIGTRLLKTLESFARSLGATDAFLWVKKNTYPHEWYIREGYKYYKEHDQPGYIWLKKQIYEPI